MNSFHKDWLKSIVNWFEHVWLWDTKLDLISQLRALIPSFLASLTMEAATLLPFTLACRGNEKAVTDSGPSCATQGISHSGASLLMSSGVG